MGINYVKFSTVVLVIFLTSQNPEAQQKMDRSIEEEAIRKVIATYVDTWNHHDMKRWSELFTKDVDYVNRGGGWWKSNQENITGHESIHRMLIQQKQKMTYASSVEKITFLTPAIAVVHATWMWPGFVLPSGEEAKDFKGIITMVMVKQDTRWLIRVLQNTVTINASPSSRQ